MITIFKIGGNVINDQETLMRFLTDFSNFPGKKILVHGGGKEATELSKKTGIETKMIEGRRVTDRETLDLVTMVYAGLINKRIVAMLQKMQCNALGLTGADAHVIPADKRNPEPIDYGYVGDIDPADINTGFIESVLDMGCVPVFCAICLNKKGGLLNCNADSIASALAVACSHADTTDLIYCFEKPGVLTQIDDDSSVIPHITPFFFKELKESGKVSGGMIPKVSNALMAVEKGVNSVRICSASDFINKGGTLIHN